MIFLDDPKVVKDPGAPKSGIPGPIHLVRRGDYLCGIIREYEENRRMLIEQQAVIANMPVKEGFGYDHPAVAPAVVNSSSSGGRGGGSSSKAAAAAAAAAANAADKGKRRKTPEYTDSEEEEYESMDEDAVKELLRPSKRHLVSFFFCHRQADM
jgi:chromodomain-helicase-DNA-binding protein 1